MNINLTIDQASLTADAKALIDKSALDTVKDQIRLAFRQEAYHNTSFYQPAGAMTKLINEKVDELFLDPKTQVQIDAYIKTHLEEALRKAIEMRVQHLANKTVFSKEVDGNKHEHFTLAS